MPRTLLPKPRGRPFKTVFINVEIHDKTRKAINELKKVTGLRTQGQVLDHLLADVMSRRPAKRRRAGGD